MARNEEYNPQPKENKPQGPTCKFCYGNLIQEPIYLIIGKKPYLEIASSIRCGRCAKVYNLAPNDNFEKYKLVGKEVIAVLNKYKRRSFTLSELNCKDVTLDTTAPVDITGGTNEPEIDDLPY